MEKNFNVQDQYLSGFECLLPQSNRILPSYENIIGKAFGDLTVVKLLRKNNRNILDCKCSCGRHQFLYRWQLKDRLSCSVCGKYSKQYFSKKNDLDVQFFNTLKSNNENFQITYKYANDLLKKQHHRCAYTGAILLSSNNCNNCTLDKINPKKGFIKNNVQWVCKQVKKMKGQMSNKQFLCFCKKIVLRNKEHQNNDATIQKIFL